LSSMPMQARRAQAVLPVFVLAPAADLARELHLPSISTNLFQRLIRNPRPESYRAKERECAEMLCALLQNAPGLRLHLLRWLGAQVGLDMEKLDGLRFAIDTEQPIGTKRDDLRIIGLPDDPEADRPLLIWTIEIKVGASFHESAAQLTRDETPPEDDPTLVNQLRNYDCWLAQQHAEHCAGFVLALHDTTADLPNLECRWACSTWTGLGEQIADALRTAELPDAEQMLAKHALGFIREHLWRTSEMANAKLDYNDVSLIRAFGFLSKDCEAKVNALVASLADVVEQSGIGKGEVEHQQSLFKGLMRSTVTRALASDSAIYAGIGGNPESGGDYLSVWIESPAKHPQKQSFKARLRGLKDRLLQRNPKWVFCSQEAETGWMAWDDAELTVPLVTLLVHDDQEEAIRRFVGDALNDLKETGVMDAFDKTIGTQRNK
jgi:hypothetical protein